MCRERRKVDRDWVVTVRRRPARRRARGGAHRPHGSRNSHAVRMRSRVVWIHSQLVLPQIEDCVKTASVNRGASIKNLVCLGNDDKAFDGTEHPIFRVVIKTLYLADVSRAAQIDRDLLVLAEQKVLPIPYKRTCNFLQGPDPQ